MSDGRRSLPNMLNRLFSFFKYKKYHRHQNDVSGETDDWTHYNNVKAKDIMIPRSDIVAIDYKSSLQEIIDSFLSSRHTRIPIYKKDLDNIVGFINIKDVFPYFVKHNNTKEFKIDDVLRKLLIAPQSMKLFTLLEEMKKTRTHIALVVDEFGGVDGLITIEDLIEEIIGKIEDEHDQIEAEIKDLGNGKYEASGRVKIESLEEKLAMNLMDGDSYDTLGGLILSICGNVPEKGKKIIHSNTNLVFEILDSDLRRIKKVLITTP